MCCVEDSLLCRGQCVVFWLKLVCFVEYSEFHSEMEKEYPYNHWSRKCFASRVKSMPNFK